MWSPEVQISYKDDFTKWKPQDKKSPEHIELEIVVEIGQQDDEGLFRFLQDYLQVNKPDGAGDDTLTLRITIRHTKEQSAPRVTVSLGELVLEDLKALEIMRKFKSSLSVIFYDSTEFFHPFRFLESTALFSEMSAAESSTIASAKKGLDKALSKVAKRHQLEVTQVLGRLKDKYKLGLKVTESDTSDVPYSITLGTQELDVELEKWGSGTQNRTRILMSLFKAKQVRESEASPDKITPVLVIEEPESYLHPSAQAEFGKILQDLSEELKVQVIVTTHSPYLLSLSNPGANLLLERVTERKRARRTAVVETAGDRWMEPFRLALGFTGDEIGPWKEVLFSAEECVLLVEGDTDAAYLQLLRNEAHGSNQLKFNGSIFAYNGKNNLADRQLVRFIVSKFKKFILTYDLDCDTDISKALEGMGLIRGKHFISLGKPTEGRKDMEGLLPENVLKKVFTENVELVQRSMVPTTKEARSAKNALKKKYLEEFTASVEPASDGYREFYILSRQLNKMFSDDSA